MQSHHLKGWGLGAAALLTAACASTPPAEPAIAAGAASIEAARSAGAPEFASAQLDTARAKLERARALAQVGRNEEALALAQQADVDAQLARAIAGSERSRRAAAEIETGLRALREELGRGAAPAASAPPRPAP
jgi:Domain of unknown function (DUF4398)